MALDLNALKAKLKAMEEGKPKSRKWKPKDEHIVRCLPLEGEEDLAFIIKWHYGVDNGRQMACPTTWGDECPFCDLSKYLRSWKDEKGRDKPEAVRKKDWDWNKKVEAAIKHYVPVVERAKGSDKLEGPFLWEMTPKTYQALFKICCDDERNAEHQDGGALRILTSLEHGTDVTVVLKKKGEKGNTTSFDLTEVAPKLRTSPLIKGDLAAAKALLARVPTMGDIAKPVSTEDAEKVFATWQASMDSAPADTKDPGVEYTGDEGNSGETVAKGGASVNETVAKLEQMLKGA
jgi:hypothetical protein